LIKFFILHGDELPKFKKFLSIINLNFLVADQEYSNLKINNNLLFTNSMKRIVRTRW